MNCMTPVFWRKDKLTPNEETLLEKCLTAHREATFRDNLSSQVVRAAYFGNNQDFLKAVSAGLCTTGGLHAPIIAACELLENYTHDGPVDYGYLVTVCKHKLPGWGSAFVKGKPDEIVQDGITFIGSYWQMGNKISDITKILHDKGKNIYPNMACLTAATALILGMPKMLAPVLFLQGRAMAWAQLIHDTPRPSPQA
jgi:citrate synthase